MFHGPGVVLDRVASGTQPLTRLSIAGRFPMRDLDATVLLDGQAIGRGIPTADLHSLRVLLPRAVHPRTGTTVSYRYGAERPVGLGTLKAGS